MKRFVIVILLYLLFVNIYSFDINISKHKTIVTKSFVDTIHIDFIENMIIIPVTLNGEEKKFLFDTGASLMIKNELQSIKDTQLLGRAIMTDANDYTDSIQILKLSNFELGNIKFKDCTSLLMDSIPDFLNCLGIEGIVGTNILADLIIKIDVKSKILIITDKKNFFKKEKGYSGSLKTNKQNLPILSIYPIKGIKEDVLFDTGDNAFYSLSNRSFTFFKERYGISDNIIDHAIGASGIGLWGFEKDSLKHMLVLNNLIINGLPFRNVHTVTSSTSNSRIGSDILNYGKVILDFIKYEFTFIPYDNRVKSEIQVSAKSKGFSVTSDENGILRVSLVWEKSNAYRAGLRKGFIITQVDNTKIEGVCNIFSILEKTRTQNEIKLSVIDLDGVKREIVISK